MLSAQITDCKRQQQWSLL